MPNERVSIRIDPDDTATFERAIELPAENGMPARQRLLESKRVDAAALLPVSVMTDILPNKCRFVHVWGENRVYVTEDQPCIRQVHWLTDSNTYSLVRSRLQENHGEALYGESREVFTRRLNAQKIFRLAFPYIVWVHLFRAERFVASYLWYRKKPLTTLRDGLMVPNLPNRYRTDGRLCLGKAFEMKLDRNQPISAQITEVEADFWNSAWNQDLIEEFMAAAILHNQVASPWEWEANTFREARFMLSIPWRGLDETLGTVLRAIVVEGAEGKAASFNAFVQRIQKADNFDRFKPPVSDSLVSPTENIVLSDGSVLAIGDRVSLDRRRIYLDVDASIKESEIEWFSYVNQDSDRSVKLKDMIQPLPIIVRNSLIAGVRVVNGYQTNVATIQGIALERGTICHIPYGQRQISGYCLVVSSRKNAFGQISVRFQNSNADVVVGENDKLHEGFRIMPASAVDGSRSTATFSDGSTLKIGDGLFLESGGQLKRLKIGSFLPISNGGTARFGDSYSGNIYELEDRSGKLKDVFVRIGDQPIKTVKVAGRTYRSGMKMKFGERIVGLDEFSPLFRNEVRFVRGNGTGRWEYFSQENDQLLVRGWMELPTIKITDQSVEWKDGNHKETLRVGDSYCLDGFREINTIVRFEKYGDSQILVHWKKNPSPTLVIDNYGWLGGHQKVLPRIRTPTGITLTRGTGLRLRVKIGGYEVGTRLTVSHIIGGKENKPPIVVTSHGLAFSLTSEALSVFEVRLPCRKAGLDQTGFKKKTGRIAPNMKRRSWLPLVNEVMIKSDQLGLMDMTKLVSTEPFKTGDRVRYLGGDPGVYSTFDEDEAKKHIARVVARAGGSRFLCEFPVQFRGLHNDNCFSEERYQNLQAEYLSHVVKTTDRNTSAVFCQAFDW